MTDAERSLGEGVREKLRRANLHRAEFDRRLQRFLESDVYRVARHDDLEAGRRAWVLKKRGEPPLVAWGALIGDCLFNLRSALDHMAYDLAVAHHGHPLPERIERCSAFPIFWRRAPETHELDKMIGAVHPDARDLIETMQPYGRKDRAALCHLDRLQNFDKHRTLHLVVATTALFSHWGAAPFDTLNLAPLHDGDELASGPIPGSSEHDQDPDFTLGVAFAESGPASGISVSLMLHWICLHVERGVLDVLTPYL